MTTPTRRLADTMLVGGIDRFIADRRAGKKPASWRRIALDLRDATDGQIDVTPETLRNWSRVSALSVPTPGTAA